MRGLFVFTSIFTLNHIPAVTKPTWELACCRLIFYIKNLDIFSFWADCSLPPHVHKKCHTEIHALPYRHKNVFFVCPSRGNISHLYWTLLCKWYDSLSIGTLPFHDWAERLDNQLICDASSLRRLIWSENEPHTCTHFFFPSGFISSFNIKFLLH